MLTEAQLRAFLPTLPAGTMWTAALNAACERFAITAPVRLAAFLAQVAHESGGFKRLVENLNYSAKRLMEVWPTRFPTLASAQPYEHQADKLANYVYANRLGNGDAASGDGWRYRGRGLIQLTGLGNYRAAEQRLGLPLVESPDQVTLPDVAALTAGDFWDSKHLNTLADSNTEASFDQISRKINGGGGGLVERRSLWVRAKAVLT